MEIKFLDNMELGLGEYVRDRSRAALRVVSGIWAAGRSVELCQTNHPHREYPLDTPVEPVTSLEA